CRRACDSPRARRIPPLVVVGPHRRERTEPGHGVAGAIRSKPPRTLSTQRNVFSALSASSAVEPGGDVEAILALEDGTFFRGAAAGAEGLATGEVVFNTAMTGYQEVLTDPSYAGQIVTMTCPEIGNYGVSPDDVESRAPQVAGFIVREESPVASNWRAKGTLRDYLITNRIVAIADIDTRALTRKLRSGGVLRGIVATGDGLDPKALVEQANA